MTLSNLSIPFGKKLGWDLFIFIVLIYLAFELPYEFFIGVSPSFEKTNDIFILTIFILDMLVNLFAQDKANKFLYKQFVSLFSIKCNTPSDELIRNQPNASINYISSKWFLIDLFSTIPWDLILVQFTGATGIKIFKIIKINKIFKGFRAVKLSRLLYIFDRHFFHYPSIKRMIFSTIGLIYIIHFSSCIHAGFISSTYFDSFQLVVTAMLTASIPSSPPAEIFLIDGFIIISGMLFLGILISNFSVYFGQIDDNAKDIDNRIKKWRLLFKAYPVVFNKDLQLKIVTYEKQREYDTDSSDYKYLIQSLSANLEKSVYASFEKNYGNESNEINELLKLKSV